MAHHEKEKYSFGRIESLLSSKAFYYCLLLTTLLAVIPKLGSQFTDQDTLIYTLIGRGIYQHWSLPYQYAFDHKPFITYIIYGPLSFFTSRYNIYAIFSAIIILLSAWTAYNFLVKKFVSFALLAFILGIANFHTVNFSGNSELVYVLFEFMAIGFILNARSNRKMFLLSATSTVLAFNTNYVVAVALLPALLYCLVYISGSLGKAVVNTLYYGLACIAIMSIMLLILAAAGADIKAYFTLQFDYLAKYGEEPGRPSTEFLLIAIGPLAILPCLFMRSIAPTGDLRSTCIALCILMTFSSISFFLSGKYFAHYLYSSTAPAVIAITCFNVDRAWFRVGAVCALIVGAIVNVAVLLRGPLEPAIDIRNAYAPLIQEVSGTRVLSMRARIAPLFFSQAEPFQKLVWYDHAHILYGSGEDRFYAVELAKRPPFVLTDHDWCESDGNGWSSCHNLAVNYQKLFDFPGIVGKPYTGYELYKLK